MYKRAACPLYGPKKGPNPKVYIGRRNPAKKAGGIGFVGGGSGGKNIEDYGNSKRTPKKGKNAN